MHECMYVVGSSGFKLCAIVRLTLWGCWLGDVMCPCRWSGKTAATEVARHLQAYLSDALLSVGVANCPVLSTFLAPRLLRVEGAGSEVRACLFACCFVLLFCFLGESLPFVSRRHVALPCLALPHVALPCLALPCLALPCLALPHLTSPHLASLCHAYAQRCLAKPCPDTLR